jgi:lysophospholipase L1-like esterase
VARDDVVPAGQRSLSLGSPSRRRLLLWGAGAGYVLALHVLLLVLLLKTNFLLLAGKTLGWIPPEEWNLPLYAAILAQAEADAGVPDGAVILLGDSIMAQLDPQDIADGAVNFGLGGDTTGTLYRRLAVLRSVARSQAVVVGVGVNDLKYRKVEQIVRDYRQVLARLAAVTRVFVVSVLPVDAAGQAARKRPYLRNQTIEALNRGLRMLCLQQRNCRFLDAGPAIAASASDVYGSDGWHLSVSGRHVLADFLRDSLMSAD